MGSKCSQCVPGSLVPHYPPQPVSLSEMGTAPKKTSRTIQHGQNGSRMFLGWGDPTEPQPCQKQSSSCPSSIGSAPVSSCTCRESSLCTSQQSLCSSATSSAASGRAVGASDFPFAWATAKEGMRSTWTKGGTQPAPRGRQLSPPPQGGPGDVSSEYLATLAVQCELVCTTPIKHSPCLNSHPSPRCDSPLGVAIRPGEGGWDLLGEK
eukprot:XP_025001420.1 gametocyte-specific factor 1 isoform X2 [Gallus gallus]